MVFGNLIACESQREARRQLWNVKMVLVGSVIVWLAAVIPLQLGFSSMWVLEVIEIVGVLVVLVSSGVFYLANEEWARWREEDDGENVV